MDDDRGNRMVDLPPDQIGISIRSRGFRGADSVLRAFAVCRHWIDRLDRRKVLIWTQAIPMVQALLLAWLTLSGRVTFHWVLWLSLVQGVVGAFDFPARHAFMLQMVEDRRDLGNAIAINSSMVNGAKLLGPSLAGVLIAATNEGWCFLIDGVSYVVVIASLLRMQLHVPQVRAVTASALAAFREGWTYVSRDVAIRTILLLVAVTCLMGMPYSVLMPVFAGQVLHGGPNTLGFLMGAMGMGSLISALSLTVRKSVLGLSKMIPIAAAAFGVGLIGFGLSKMFWLSMGMMLVVGFGVMQCMAVCNTIIQTIASEDKRGRVMSFFTVAFVGMPPFGCLLAGTLARGIGAPATVTLIGSAVMAGAIWFTTRLSAVRREIRSIYEKTGLLPAEVPAVLEDAGVG